MNKEKAAFYLRVSTVDQSYDRQFSDLTQVSSKHFLVEEDDIYADKLSGYKKHEDRPALKRLLEDIESGLKKYHTLFVWETSRLSRNPDEAKAILTKITDAGVQVYVHNIKMGTHNLDGSRNISFHLVYTLMSEFGNLEAQNFKLRVRSGQKEKIRKGGTGGGNRLNFGYTRSEDKKLVVDPEEEKWVKQIFQWSVEGYGYKQIAHKLNEASVETKFAKINRLKLEAGELVEKASQDLKFREATVEKILNNEIYMGKRTWDGEVVPVPEIITEELFEQAREARKERKGTQGEWGRWNYLFNGIMYCGICGAKMSGRFKEGGNVSYYMCTSKRMGKCDNISCSIEALESSVWDLLKNNPKMYETVKRMGVELNEVVQKIDGLKVQHDIEKKNLREKEGELEGWNLLLVKKRVKEARYDVEVAKIEKSIVGINRKINNLKNEIKALTKMKERLSSNEWYDQAFKKVTSDRYSIKEMVHSIVGRIIITSVETHHNNTDHLVSIFLRDLLPPITMVLKQKPRWMGVEDFIEPVIAQIAGQGKFMYVSYGALGEDLIKYRNNKLVGNVKKVLWKMDNDMDELDKKFFTEDYMCTVPFLLPFVEQAESSHQKLKEPV